MRLAIFLTIVLIVGVMLSPVGEFVAGWRDKTAQYYVDEVIEMIDGSFIPNSDKRLVCVQHLTAFYVSMTCGRIYKDDVFSIYYNPPTIFYKEMEFDPFRMIYRYDKKTGRGAPAYNLPLT